MLTEAQADKDAALAELALAKGEADAEIDRLQAIIDAFRRHRFGARSEQLDPDQLQLGLEDVETALGQARGVRDAASPLPRGSEPPITSPKNRKTGRDHVANARMITPRAASVAKRRFFEASKFYVLADTSPVGTEILPRIAVLYAIEDEVRGSPAEQRRAAREERSRVIIDDLKRYLEARFRQVSTKSKLAEAIRYALGRWNGLTHFLDDGRIDLDTNTVERSIRLSL